MALHALLKVKVTQSCWTPGFSALQADSLPTELSGKCACLVSEDM